LDNGLTHLDATLDAAEVVRVNDGVQARRDLIRDQLAREIGVDPAQDIVHVPILYVPSAMLGPALLDALTAGMVNMLVTDNHCTVPKPFGLVARG